MPRGAGLAAGEQEAVVGDRARSEVQTFWPLTKKWSPSRTARVGQIGEVGAGTGLGEALAPDLIGVEDGLEPALLLRVGAVHHEGRRHHAEADGVHAGRGPGRDQLLGEDRLVRIRRAAAAVLGGPRETGKAGLVELCGPLSEPGSVEKASSRRGGRGSSSGTSRSSHWRKARRGTWSGVSRKSTARL